MKEGAENVKKKEKEKDTDKGRMKQKLGAIGRVN